MGDYTTYYNLYKPAAHENGVALLVDANFDTIDGELQRLSDAVSGYYAPVTDPSVPELLFDAEGDCIMAFVPL